MRWAIFAILAYVLLSLEQGLRTALSVGWASPSLLLTLLVFVSLSGPRATVVWVAIVLGLLVDLTTPLPVAGRAAEAAIIGPACIGYLVGAYAAMQLRGVVFRDSPLTIAAMVFVAGLIAHVVIVGMLSLRGMPWLLAERIPGWSAADQLVDRFLDLLYSSACALPLGFVLVKFEPYLGLWHHPPGGRSRR